MATSLFSEGPHAPVQFNRCSDASGARGELALLVSVRNLAEAADAADAGAMLLDFKEPRLGALAPVEPSLWDQAAKWRDQRRDDIPLSAALGEAECAISIARRVPPSFAFAKPGTRGCGSVGQLQRLWASVRENLPATVRLVAVAYADAQDAMTSDAETVFLEAARCGIRHCLIDTYGKDGRSSLDHLDHPKLTRLSRLADDLGLWWALSGSLRQADLERLRARQIVPDCFGVRGDVCGNGRQSELEPARVALWRAKVDAFAGRTRR